ncbi:acyl-CoA-binding domain-containing protein 4 isoform X3 [Vanacampus margaritifer]
MLVPEMLDSMVDHQKRFQAAVNVIHKLPKKGSYQPSYDVMLRFYGLYKQAMFGPCAVPRPGFWDPVGRYKWDAWSRLGDMSCTSAMAAYVDEMKKVAQEVIDSLPMNEKNASLFHHFEPLYAVIVDMPRPPETLLNLRKVCESSVLTSKSDCDIFCDSVDSVEELNNLKIPLVKSPGFLNDYVAVESSLCQRQQQESRIKSRHVGAGHGGEGKKDAKDQGTNRSRTSHLEDSYLNWREWDVPMSSGGPGAERGGDVSDSVPEWQHEVHLQQQILFTLRKLRDDMRSVMERLDVVEMLVTTHACSSDWTPCLKCAVVASQQQEEKWWPFDASGETVLLFLLCPFAAQGILYLLQKIKKRNHILQVSRRKDPPSRSFKNSRR